MNKDSRDHMNKDSRDHMLEHGLRRESCEENSECLWKTLRKQVKNL